ncbi:hypothetical protein ACT4R9_04750 [Ornithobacterium rhinotracheale]|uniref:hypothetical protein n=1 Tax=Ornithobacterium rhinotracheale TaxID=28251 RepID=UPI003FA48CED
MRKYLFCLSLFVGGAMCAQNVDKGSVGINTMNPTAKLHVNGNMRISKTDESLSENKKELAWDPVSKFVVEAPAREKLVFQRPSGEQYGPLYVQVVGNNFPTGQGARTPTYLNPTSSGVSKYQPAYVFVTSSRIMNPNRNNTIPNSNGVKDATPPDITEKFASNGQNWAVNSAWMNGNASPPPYEVEVFGVDTRYFNIKFLGFRYVGIEDSENSQVLINESDVINTLQRYFPDPKYPVVVNGDKVEVDENGTASLSDNAMNIVSNGVYAQIYGN